MNYKSDYFFTSVFRLLLLPFFYFYVKHIVKGQWRETGEKKQKHESRVRASMCVCIRVYICACVIISSVILWCVSMSVCVFSAGEAMSVSRTHAVLIEE